MTQVATFLNIIEIIILNQVKSMYSHDYIALSTTLMLKLAFLLDILVISMLIS